MSAPEFKATKRYTVLQTHTDIAQQIKEAQENAQPIRFDIESEVGNHSVLTLTLRFFEPLEDRNLLHAMSERQENVTVYIPHDPQESAIAILPN